MNVRFLVKINFMTEYKQSFQRIHMISILKTLKKSQCKFYDCLYHRYATVFQKLCMIL